VPLPVWAGNIKADITIKIANRFDRYKSMVFSSKPVNPAIFHHRVALATAAESQP
jgi:hypothetical protein